MVCVKKSPAASLHPFLCLFSTNRGVVPPTEGLCPLVGGEPCKMNPPPPFPTRPPQTTCLHRLQEGSNTKEMACR